MAIPSPTPGSAALVTGASSGIGRELSTQLAARGHDIILVARRKDRLEALAEEIRAVGRRAEPLSADLSDPSDRASLPEQISALGLRAEVLALAAGFGIGGTLLEQDPDRLEQLVRTNVGATVGLVRLLAPEMAQRGRGAILIVSSIADYQPMPGFAAYAASKAAVTSFGESLHEELRRSGVTVTVLSPGAVETEFADVAGNLATHRKVPKAMLLSPEACAAEGLRALERGQRRHVPLTPVRIQSYLSGHLPRNLWLRVCARMMS